MIEKLKEIFSNKITWFVIGGILLVTIAIIVFVNLNDEDKKPKNLSFNLNGPESITLYVGDEYVEYGYSAFYDEEDITDEVKVENNVDMTKSGNYEVKYSVKYKSEKDNLTRSVIVKELDKARNLKLDLKGEFIVTLEQNSPYVEAGYTASDDVEGDLTSKVIVDGEIKTSDIGEQQITYRIRNTKGEIVERIRIVNVVASNFTLDLLGSERVTISEGSIYNDPGYYAYDSIDEELTNDVVVTGSVNTKSPGTYTIRYVVTNGRGKKLEKTRTVTVLKEEKVVAGVITFNLFGNLKETLELNQRYNEAGYFAFDTKDGEITSKVKVIGNVDTSKAGKYLLIYKVSNSAGSSKTLIREIEVKEDEKDKETALEIVLEADNKTITNQSINVRVIVSGTNFARLVLPNNTETTSKDTTYKVDNNGYYEFKAYDNAGKMVSKGISLTNIDKEGPKGSCVVDINGYTATVRVSATDNLSEVTGYKYNLEGTYSSYLEAATYSATIKEFKETKVIAKDRFNNETEITCTKGSVVYPPVIPTKNVIMKATDSETMNLYVTKKDGYYASYIWVKDAHSQVKKFSTTEYNKTVSSLNTIASKALTNANLKNKIAIMTNNDISPTYGGYYVGKVKGKREWNKYATTGLVINNGKVMINRWDSDATRAVFAGIGEDNILRFYKEKRHPKQKDWTEEYHNKRKALYDKAINTDKIQNTITVNYHMMENGNVPNDYKKNEKKAVRRTVLCQINENNFIMFSTYKSITGTKMYKIGKNLGCQNMINMDGGGSVLLYYKSNKKSSWTKAINTTRPRMYSVLYFTE